MLSEETRDGLNVSALTEDVCMDYLYQCMPVSDMADYEEELFRSFVIGALKARANTPWGECIPEEVFLNYVLNYRVNNENIEDYREMFFEEIYPRLEGKSMKDAALEVNYWCLEKATYQSTDGRTASPLTVIRNTYGRCGEESTFLVSALRSVCIPARQCYAPRWAHCDDNHAWVEVWIDGTWHYMGACEPEPVLDTGWFDLAAARAMMTQVKVFGRPLHSEEVVEASKIVSVVNTLDYYTETKVVEVKVVDQAGNGVSDAKVRWELLNYSELYPIATSYTDAEGKGSIKTGYGDLVIHISKEGRFYHQKIDVRTTDCITVDWSQSRTEEIGEYEFDMVPPMVESVDTKVISKEQTKMHEEKVRKANQLRQAYADTFYIEESANEWASKYSPYQAELASYLVKSRGNYEVIKNYIEEYPEIPLQDKVGLLSTLKLKDYTDITLEALVDHSREALAYKGQYEEEIYTQYILAPRIYLEMIVPYKKALIQQFDEDQKQSFRACPETIIEYIKSHIGGVCGDDYPTLYATPVGTMKVKRGSKLAQNILFVAICRALGIPAYLHKMDGSITYYTQGQWMNTHIEETKPLEPMSVTLELQKSDQVEWQYGTHYSVARLVEGVYETLNCYGSKWDGNKQVLSIRPGQYRVITSNRQIDGTILARSYMFSVEPEEHKILEIALRPDELYKQLKEVQVEAKELEDLQTPHNIVVWLELGKEPTEHILNEIREQKERYNTLDTRIVFLVEGQGIDTDPTLRRTLEAVKNIEVKQVPDMTEIREHICGKFHVFKSLLPLATVMTKDQKVRFACSGYNVGLADLLLKVVDLLESR